MCISLFNINHDPFTKHFTEFILSCAFELGVGFFVVVQSELLSSYFGDVLLPDSVVLVDYFDDLVALAVLHGELVVTVLHLGE